MGVLLAFLCMGLILVGYELLLRLTCAVDVRGRQRLFNRLEHEGLRQLIAVVKMYAGFRVVVDSTLSQQLPRSFLLIANHQSLADIPVLAYSLPRYTLRFVAKKELGRGIPGLSFALRKGEHALIDRQGDFKAAQAQLVRLAQGSREGVCPTVFPEGTRSRTGRVGQFHSAAVRTILSHSELPVVSVAVGGGFRVSHFRDLVRNLGNCVYRVRFLSLYPPARERTSVHRILQESQEEIAKQVEQWTQQET